MIRVSSVSFRTLFNDLVDGVCVVQFLDVKRDADHNFLSVNKKKLQFNIFLADGYRIKVTMESESCPLNPHLAGKFFCATWFYVTREYVHNVIETFPWHSRDKNQRNFQNL